MATRPLSQECWQQQDLTCWSQQGPPCPGAAPWLLQAKRKNKKGTPRWERQRGEEGALSPPFDKVTLKRTEPSERDGLQTLLSRKGTTLNSGTSVQGPSCPQELSAHMSLPCLTMVLPELHPASLCSTSLHLSPSSFRHILAWIWPLCKGPQAAPSSASWQRGQALPASPPLPGKHGKTS